MSYSLPTSRQLLTSLLNAISSIPIPEQGQQKGDYSGQQNSAPNPLKPIEHVYRPLFTTLHVLFPTLLLPAFDLLDRGLVSRLILERKTDTRHGPNQQHKTEEQAKDHGIRSEIEAAATVYIVRSAQQPRRHFGGGNSSITGGGGSSSTGQAYVVYMNAWNCTCAAFAFSAFPGGGLPPAQQHPDVESKGKEKEGEKSDRMVLDPAPSPASALSSRTDHEQREEESVPWQFGGMSFDGIEGGDGADGVPCCKHLLACVLADKWAWALGRYVIQRTVGKEEMAGIVADV